MDLKIESADRIGGTVEAPPSKSYTHRAFIIAALAKGESRIVSPLRAQDTNATLEALRAFGIEIEDKGDIFIKGSGGVLKTPDRIVDTMNSGTSIRLLATMAALGGKVVLTGDESIQKRPIQPLLDALSQLGVSGKTLKGNGCPPFEILGGGISGGTTKIPGNISSQFISSILISSPYADSDVTVELTTPLKSKPYVDITLDIARNFGIEFENHDYQSFSVKAGRTYQGREYRIEGDYSSASYFIALAAMAKSRITVNNLVACSRQGDRVILDIVHRMGAGVESTGRGVKVSGRSLQGIRVDLSDSPDLLPTVAAMAVVAKGKTIIENVEHARYKESDRIAACAKEFRKFGAKIEEKRDGLIIEGTVEPVGAVIETYHDHRMAMAGTILALVSKGSTVIKGAECVDISYPGFFENIKRLRGQY